MRIKATVCGAILSKKGDLLLVDLSTDEETLWNHRLGWPDEEEIAAAKARGERFTLVKIKGEK